MSAMEDPAKYESLANDVYVYGSVSLALAMAKETNMVDCLCSAESPLSSADIAGQLKLKERYVREVLNSLTAIGLVQLEAGTGGKEGKEAKYWVPPPCRETLKTFGAFTLAISASVRHYPDMRKCFDLNGPPGVRYHPDSFQLMDKIAEVQVDSIVEAILETPGLRERLEKGIKALEVGCGTGWLFLRFASMFPSSHFTMTDPIAEPLEVARKKAESQGLKNVSFQVLDIFERPENLAENFDWVASMEVIHDLPYPLRALKEIVAMLKPGGQYSLVDQFVPGTIRDNVDSRDAASLYAIGTFLCVPESFQQPDSEALGPCWGTEKAYELVKAAGLTVLGLTRKESLGTLGVCMCQKPE
ncbi:S-adenosylmethionine-dependent methyltransferase Rv2258c-like [Babylonia areolata]|uniref:S-adenosylmethionine-dependent methyltransferase Rv2258c-like n=1 Tax=Babylonia areolata TaxID=304850 RepID=UPI003FD648C7